MNKRGMALIEVVVSMLVLAVAALGVVATISLVNSSQMRSAGGSSLDLQALSYARDTLESLKNSVSTDAVRAAALSDNLGTPNKCNGKDIHAVCDAGEVHVPAGGGAVNGLPPGTSLQTGGGVRRYKVQDVSDATNVPGSYAYKKVTVCVAWPPDACQW